MGHLSTHVLDTANGCPAAGMQISLQRLEPAGAVTLCSLALNDDGRPAHDPRHAALLAAMGVPVFACTPDLFPAMMAAALLRQDLALWARGHDVRLERPEGAPG